jgi:hypothetical protein
MFYEKGKTNLLPTTARSSKYVMVSREVVTEPRKTCDGCLFLPGFSPMGPLWVLFGSPESEVATGTHQGSIGDPLKIISKSWSILPAGRYFR